MSDNLKKAIKNLPEFKAPDSVWDNIDSELNIQNAELPMKIALKRLPVYEPTGEVWENIAKNLPHPKPILRILRRPFSIAASIIILIGLGAVFFNTSSQADYKYAYSEEVLNEKLQLDVYEADEDAFAMISDICSEKSYLCQHVDFQQLRSDFEDLNSAYEELQYAISEFNTSPELMEEITNIELERTVVFKQLLAML